MDNLYIKIVNGAPSGHPVLKQNLIDAFGSIPPNWEQFTRVEQHQPNAYQTAIENAPIYQKVSGVWQDVWVTEISPVEKMAKIQATQLAWSTQPNAANFSAWKFDVDTCTYLPPTPKPTDGQNYVWSGARNSWVEVPST
jgi:hypothetical protein